MSAPPAAFQALRLKVAVRVLPLIFVIYITAYLDRANVGFAKLRMASDLGFSEEIFGLGIGPAVAMHEGSTLVVVFNALRLLAFRDNGAKGD